MFAKYPNSLCKANKIEILLKEKLEEGYMLIFSCNFEGEVLEAD